MPTLKQQITQICDKFDEFNPSEYLNDLPVNQSDLTGTILDIFLKDINIVLTRHPDVTTFLVTFIGMSVTNDAECVEAYFAISYIAKNQLHTIPVKIESA